MRIYRIRNLHEWQKHARRMEEEYTQRREWEWQLVNHWRKLGGQGRCWLQGFSYPAGQEVKFIFEMDSEPINWRETLICPVTGLFNRVRACVHLFETECGPYREDSIYLMEQKTPAYSFLSRRYPNLIGGEYLGESLNSGEIGEIIDGLRHEDVTRLSFPDESINHILSFDVFEHVPEYLKGLQEYHRVLAKGGTLLWTVPFIRQNAKTTVRAVTRPNGKIDHILEPEYHGDPVNPKGVLCFYHFGWDLLEEVREIGFSEAYALLFWSDLFGYLGSESIIFVAIK